MPRRTWPATRPGSTPWRSSPDGKQAAAASAKTVKLWDLAAGTPVKDLEGHAGDVESVAWRADGAQIASGDKARTIRLWNAADGAPQGVIETPADTVLGLAYLPNNQQLVSAGSDGLARLWQLPVAEPRVIDAKGAVSRLRHEPRRREARHRPAPTRSSGSGTRPTAPSIKEIAGSDEPITALAFKGDGGQVAIALASKVVRICNVADGAEVKKTEALPSPVTALAFRADGAQVAAAGEDNAASGSSTSPTRKVVKAMPGHAARIHALAFAPNDGNLLVSASADKTAKLWDVNEGKPVRDFAGHAEAVLALNVSPRRDEARDRLGRQDDQGLDRRRRQERRHPRRATPGRSRRSSSPTTATGSPAVRPTTRSGSGTPPPAASCRALTAHGAAILGVCDPARQCVGRLGRASTTRSGSGSRPPSGSTPGTQGPVFGVAVHPNGSQVDTASADKTVKVFDANTGNRRPLARRPRRRRPGGRAHQGRSQDRHRLGRQDDQDLERRRRQAPADLPGAAGRRPGASPPRADNKLLAGRPGRQHGQGLRPDPGRPGQGRAPGPSRATPARSSPSRSCPTTRRSSPPRRTRRSRSGP